ncbi:MAG: SRPBCC domain-containing protein [Alphaproteobacteria bacterium]
MTGAIHQEVLFKARAKRVYDALINEKEHGAFTGAPAEISREAGGTFSCYGGQIHGRIIELVPNKRIVQAWRVANWDEGVYSIVTVTLQEQGEETTLVLDHHGIAEAQQEHLAGGWHARYWEPLQKFLA